jgi:hypothetical protein
MESTMQAYPSARVLLRFAHAANGPKCLRQQISACAQDRDGNLWLGTDELTGLSRLKQRAPGAYGKHVYTDLSDRLKLTEEDEEIDVEGLDIEEDRLWIVGSHTSTRKGFQPGKNPEENLQRLAQVEASPNRYLIACAEIEDGKLTNYDIAQLPISEEGNPLTLALREDPHLGPFLHRDDRAQPSCAQIASKENGFDVRGSPSGATGYF